MLLESQDCLPPEFLLALGRSELLLRQEAHHLVMCTYIYSESTHLSDKLF